MPGSHQAPSWAVASPGPHGQQQWQGAANRPTQRLVGVDYPGRSSRLKNVSERHPNTPSPTNCRSDRCESNAAGNTPNNKINPSPCPSPLDDNGDDPPDDDPGNGTDKGPGATAPPEVPPASADIPVTPGPTSATDPSSGNDHQLLAAAVKIETTDPI
jgi:hypothetical protein